VEVGFLAVFTVGEEEEGMREIEWRGEFLILAEAGSPEGKPDNEFRVGVDFDAFFKVADLETSGCFGDSDLLGAVFVEVLLFSLSVFP